MWHLLTLIGVVIAIVTAVVYWKRRPLLFWLMETCLWVWVLKNVIRKIRWPGKTRMTESKYRAVYKHLEPGHIIMGIDYRMLASLLTPGTMAHAALCINQCRVIAEMVGEGDQRISARDFCFHYDRVMVIKCTDWDVEYVNQTILPTSDLFVDVKYDHAFKPGAECLYCFERIEAVDLEGRLKLVYEYLLGRKLVTGDSILNASNSGVVYDTGTVPSIFRRWWNLIKSFLIRGRG